MKVLVLDDDPMVRMNLLAYLEDEGLDVEGVESGEKALSLLEVMKPDAVLVDMRLPGMDGNEFIYRANLLMPGLRYIIHTGSTEYSLPDELFRIGLSEEDILFKPLVDMGVIVKKLER